MLVAAAFEALLGITGIVGVITKVIRPISIASMFILLGVYLWELGSMLGEVHWGIAFGSLVICLTFALYFEQIKMPIPQWSKNKGCHKTTFPIFQAFPILLTIMIMWPVSHVVTTLGGFTSNSSDVSYKARTDIHAENIRDAPAFRFPYPGYLGGMSFDVSLILFYIPCLLASMIESVGDYYQYSIACQLPPPPAHAMNRGIAVEGLGGILSAVLGAGHPTTSYSNMMGVITVTRVGNRLVMMVAGIFVATLGLIGPVGAVLVAIPRPVLFGPLILSVGFLTGSAFANLQDVDLLSRRNQVILGLSVYIGALTSFNIATHGVNTGVDMLNDIITNIFKIPFITGGIIAVFLDLSLPGKEKKRQQVKEKQTHLTDEYDLPLVSLWLKRHKFSRFIPIFPPPTKDRDTIFANCDVNKILQLDIQSTDI